MKLSQVRDYFRARILEVDTDFKEHRDGFNRDNVPRAAFNKGFHVLPGTLVSDATDMLHLDDNLSVSVQLFFKGFRDVQSAMDEALDKAHDIRLQAIKHAKAMVGQNIKNVICNSIGAEPLDSNDNAILVTLEFSVRLIFKVN